MEEQKDPTFVSHALEAGHRLGTGTITELAGVPLILIPEGYKAELHPELMQQPALIDQQIRTETAASFVEYFNEFAAENSIIFCETETARFVGIIDYHFATSHSDTPAWCKHRVIFECRETPEWEEWHFASGTTMNQTQFALFLEDNLEEIISPPGAQMLEIATTLKAKTKITFTSAKRLNDGQTQFQYVEDQEGSGGINGEVKIPETFQLGMRIFEGGTAYELEARFRYRITDGKVVMWYDLVRPHKAYRAALADTLAQIKHRLKDTLIIHGSPRS